MTPEQRANLPGRPLPFVPVPIDEHATAISTVTRLTREVHADRAARWNNEFPPGHPERSRVPQWVIDEHPERR